MKIENILRISTYHSGRGHRGKNNKGNEGMQRALSTAKVHFAIEIKKKDAHAALTHTLGIFALLAPSCLLPEQYYIIEIVVKGYTGIYYELFLKLQ